ncbi:hypothetical protein KFK09_025746 [Dendrobium nobile]|uniref:Reverse transcriptase zinc-binding domain-containing protein n=1 Tax=Dendrobium nobile TaxID=94219 RepID=A0A8T3A4S3_DENNO|nr:hypothetical protein KFK09_025746 [Dendrobium nobile]
MPLSDSAGTSCCHSARLAEWINDSGWALLDTVSSVLRKLIMETPISMDSSNILWKILEKPTFKYFYLEYFALNDYFHAHALVWHRKHSPRFSVYSWMAIMGGLKTIDELLRRNIHILDTCCFFCRAYSETVNHLMFQCDYSFKVLTRFIPAFSCFYLRPNIAQTFNFVGNLGVNRNLKCAYLLSLNAIVYHLWVERNSRRFNNVAICAVSIAKKYSENSKSQNVGLEGW